MKKIHLLITDLDNTLYDWVSSFIPAFYAMVDEASQILSVEQNILLDQLKTIHQKYHNSENPFALLETPVVKNRYPNMSLEERIEILKEAFLVFNRVRKDNLRLYCGVDEALQFIQDQGCIIIAYTEAVVENSLLRIKLLKLDTKIKWLYAPKSLVKIHVDPTLEPCPELVAKMVCPLPNNHRKPDVEILKGICKKLEIPVSNTLYIGDSMTRDISMAKLAGTHAALAKYGNNYNPLFWKKLVRITHWTDTDIKQEIFFQEEFRHIHPDIEVNSFAEIINHFNFSN